MTSSFFEIRLEFRLELLLVAMQLDAALRRSLKFIVTFCPIGEG